MGIKKLKVLGDSELVVNEIRGISSAKHVCMRSYCHKAWDLIESFDAFNIQRIPHKANASVDRMAIVGSNFDPTVDLLVNPQVVGVIVRPAIPDNDTH